MPVMNKQPGIPTTSNTKSYRFHVHAEVTGSNSEKATVVVFRSDDVQRAMQHALAIKDSRYVEVRSTKSKWQRIVRC